MLPTGPQIIDPTMPGVSPRDLTDKPVHAIVSTCPPAGGSLACGRRERALKKGLSALSAHQLRDIGLDRRSS